MGGCCLSRDFRWVRAKHRRCFWSMRMGAAWSRVRCDHGVGTGAWAADEPTSGAAGAGAHCLHAGAGVGAVYFGAGRGSRPLRLPQASMPVMWRSCRMGVGCVSVRKPGAKHFALATWKPGRRGDNERWHEEAGQDLVEPVVVVPRGDPKSASFRRCTTGPSETCWRWMRGSRGAGWLQGAPVAVRAETMAQRRKRCFTGNRAGGNRTDRSLCRRRGRAVAVYSAGRGRATRCDGSKGGSGCGAGNSGFAWVATPGRNARRTIGCRKCCCGRTTPVDADEARARAPADRGRPLEMNTAAVPGSGIGFGCDGAGGAGGSVRSRRIACVTNAGGEVDDPV